MGPEGRRSDLPRPRGAPEAKALTSKVTVDVAASPAEAAARAGRWIVDRLDEAVQRRGSARLVLSGGRTPRRLFRWLGTQDSIDLDWSSVEVFWADERMVLPTDPLSNYRLAERSFLRIRGIPPTQIHRIEGERPSNREAALEYSERLGRCLGERRPGRRRTASFDVALLGVGRDGHTASLFPGSAQLAVRDRWAVPVDPPSEAPRVPRVSLTIRGLSRTNSIVFFVTGPEKRSAVRRCLGVTAGPGARPPAARIRGRTETRWFLDRAAGTGVRGT